MRPQPIPISPSERTRPSALIRSIVLLACAIATSACTGDDTSADTDGDEGGGGGGAGGAATCEADLSSDPDNCGACARSCFGGSCEAGQCGAVSLGSQDDVWPSQLVAHEGALFIGERAGYEAEHIVRGGDIVRWPQGGGPMQRLVSPHNDMLRTLPIVPFGDGLFFASEVCDASLENCTSQPYKLALDGSALTPFGAALDDDCSARTAGGQDIFLECNGTPITLNVSSGVANLLATSKFAPHAVDETHAYGVSASSLVQRVELQSGALENLYTPPTYDDVDWVATSELAVHFTVVSAEDGSRRLMRLPKAGGEATEVAPFETWGPSSASPPIRVQGDYVYLFQESTTPAPSLARVHVDGGPIEELVQGEIIAFTTDATSLYWVVQLELDAGVSVVEMFRQALPLDEPVQATGP